MEWMNWMDELEWMNWQLIHLDENNLYVSGFMPGEQSAFPFRTNRLLAAQARLGYALPVSGSQCLSGVLPVGIDNTLELGYTLRLQLLLTISASRGFSN